MSRRLFTTTNAKIVKGQKRGFLTAILHLAPAESGGARLNGRVVNVCPFATKGCIAGCLNRAGRGGIIKRGRRTNEIQRARVRKTRALFADRAAFIAAASHEIALLKRKADRMGLTLCVRPNGTSDLPFLADALAAAHPDVQFYDYTKIPNPERRARPNYALTFSRAEDNAQHVLSALAKGTNVAVVFSTRRGKPLPATYLGRPVVDGDDTDLRFLDPKGADGRGLIIGLRAKGPARKDCSGFVVQAEA